MQKQHGCKHQLNACVNTAVCPLQLTRAEQTQDRVQKQIAKHGENQADAQRNRNQHGEVAARLVCASLSLPAGDNSAAARAEHNAGSHLQAVERIRHIDCGKRGCAGKPRNKHTVHDGVHREQHHHCNVRQCESEQRCGVEFARKCVILLHCESPFQKNR